MNPWCGIVSVRKSDTVSVRIPAPSFLGTLSTRIPGAHARFQCGNRPFADTLPHSTCPGFEGHFQRSIQSLPVQTTGVSLVLGSLIAVINGLLSLLAPGRRAAAGGAPRAQAAFGGRLLCWVFGLWVESSSFLLGFRDSELRLVLRASCCSVHGCPRPDPAPFEIQGIPKTVPILLRVRSKGCRSIAHRPTPKLPTVRTSGPSKAKGLPLASLRSRRGRRAGLREAPRSTGGPGPAPEARGPFGISVVSGSRFGAVLRNMPGQLRIKAGFRSNPGPNPSLGDGVDHISQARPLTGR